MLGCRFNLACRVGSWIEVLHLGVSKSSFCKKHQGNLPSWKLRYPPKIDGWKMKFPFKMVPFLGDMLVFRGGSSCEWYPIQFHMDQKVKVGRWISLCLQRHLTGHDVPFVFVWIRPVWSCQNMLWHPKVTFGISLIYSQMAPQLIQSCCKYATHKLLINRKDLPWYANSWHGRRVLLCSGSSHFLWSSRALLCSICWLEFSARWWMGKISYEDLG